MTDLRDNLLRLRSGARALMQVPGEIRSELLRSYAASIRDNIDLLLDENARDLEASAGHLPAALMSRLKLDRGKLTQVSLGIDDLARGGDPVGAVLERTVLDEGLVLEKVRVPLGVIGIIFESRPDVLPQVLSLAVRSGNALALKGGSEAVRSNQALLNCFVQVLQRFPSVPQDIVALLPGRESVREMIGSPEYLDLVIPRGSRDLIQAVMRDSQVPVLGHADGVCHLFVEASAHPAEAVEVILDSKVQYPAACNAVETVLVQRSIAQVLLDDLVPRAKAERVALRGCIDTCARVPDAEPAAPEDWYREYGDLILNVKIVDTPDEAIEHINHFGSHHTDGILSWDEGQIRRFLEAVDSASVFANCSTRFADGYRFGLGAEIGISTGRIHARGPVGIEGLLTYKYLLRGNGHVVRDYVGATARPFLHRKE